MSNEEEFQEETTFSGLC